MFRISPRFQRCYRKFNPTLFHWAKGFFFLKWSWKVCNLILCRKIFELFRISPTVPEFNPTHFHWAIDFFSKMVLRISFLNRKTYSLKYWTRPPSVGPSVRQSVSLSVRQSVSPSVSPSVSQSVSQSVRPSLRPEFGPTTPPP